MPYSNFSWATSYLCPPVEVLTSFQLIQPSRLVWLPSIFRLPSLQQFHIQMKHLTHRLIIFHFPGDPRHLSIYISKHSTSILLTTTCGIEFLLRCWEKHYWTVDFSVTSRFDMLKFKWFKSRRQGISEWVNFLFHNRVNISLCAIAHALFAVWEVG